MITFCINRADRPERWVDVQKELDKVGIEAQRYDAKINPIGWMGCRDSHLSCLVKIYASGFMGLILEDDVVFADNFNDMLVDAMLELPKDWDILYLGVNPQEPQEKYSPHLYKLKNVFCTHAMIWNWRENGALEAILDADDNFEIGKIDVYLAKAIQPKFNCFVTYPMITWQRQYPSDTCKRSDVSQIIKNYQRFCP